jgi:hypothetical protein
MAGEAPIKIRVGASKDASIDRMFAQVEARARTAGRVVAQSLNNAFKGMGRQPATRGRQADPFAHVPAAARKAYGQAAKEARKASFDSEKYWTKSTRNAARDSEREWRRVSNEAAKLNARAARAMDRFATRTSHRATRFFWPNMPITHVARRAAGDILRGAGVETHLAGIVGRLVRSEELATAVTTQAYRPGEKGFAGRRFPVATLQEEARGLGQEFAFSTEAILEGQKAFVDLEGDLEAARAISRDMARLAKSQNVDFKETMHTAAKANQMFASMPEYAHDTEKRFAAVNDLMGRLTYQGKVGSIVMEYMAKNFAKLSGIAGMFRGNPMKAAVQLTTLAQIAEAGPAKNPAQATQMVQSFATQLIKRGGDVERITGVKIHTPQGMRSPFEMIEEMFVATAGGATVKKRGWKQARQLTQQEALVESLGGRKEAFLGGFQGLMNFWIRATGGQRTPEALARGRRALRERFQFYGGRVSAEQQAKDLAERLKTTASKAEKFNQQLEKVMASAAEKVFPALEKLAPAALTAAKALGWLVKQAAEHPWGAVAGMIGLSIGRAFGESWFRFLIERALLSKAISKLVPGAAGTVPMVGTRGAATGGVVYRGRRGAAGAGAVAPGVSRGGFFGAPTAGGVATAGVTGLGLGIPIAASIYAGGIASFETNVEKYAELTKSIADVTGKELGPALLEYQAKLRKMEESYGAWDAIMDTFGAGNMAELRGAQELYARKRREYEEYFAKGPERRGAPKVDLQQAMQVYRQTGGKFGFEAPPATAVERRVEAPAVETAVRDLGARILAGELSVRVVNPEDFGTGEEPPRPRPGLEPTG